MIQMLIGPAIELAKDFIKGKADEKKAIQQRKITTIQNDADWESKMAGATTTSWKDEWFTLVLSAPIIAIMWAVATDDPDIIERVHKGFETLQALPDFYQTLLFIAVTASFGLKFGSSIFKK